MSQHPAGQGSSWSYFQPFSSEILEVVLNTRSEQLDKLFQGKQSQQRMFHRASQEQIRSLSQGATSSSQKGGETKRFTFNLFTQTLIYSDENGRFFEAYPHEFELLCDLDVSVSSAQINQGSIFVPHYNSEATFVILVTQGKWYVEMVYPERDETRSGKYRKVTARLYADDIFVVPAGYPFTFVTSENENLRTIGFSLYNQENRRIFIAGKNNMFCSTLVLSFGLLCSAADPFRRRREEDSRERYMDCQRRCERETRREREQDRCEERCEMKFRQEQEEGGGRRRHGSRFEECQQWCQQLGQRQQLHWHQRVPLCLIEANPNTFVLPHHCDAEKNYVVTNGKGTLTFVTHKMKESFNLVPGIVIRVPSGSTMYLVNQDNNQKLTIATQGEQLDRLFHGSQRQSQQGMFRRASQEQIRSLSQGATTPKEREDDYASNLLAQKPKYSNRNGKFFEACPRINLRDALPFRVYIVTEGKGYTEMVSLEGEEEEKRNEEYRKVKAGLSIGDIFVVPAGHPVTFVASQNQKLRFLAFGLNCQNDLKIFIGGKDNLVRQMDSAAKELAFRVPSKLVDKIFDNNPQESYFVSGQRQQRDLV
ncbi:hypothetical protein V6N11_036071 [Hibiscus sabdariffa]|uniref:Cupin type-1 domain-containing protein n=1 Tax=Hibiscus sabdariffa TaxID=183260 RepID=A0ABR2R9D7_9ROSI